MEIATERNQVFKQILNAGVLSLFFCVVSVLTLALVVKLFEGVSNALGIINQVLKGLSVFFGCFAAIYPDKGFFKGIGGGILFLILSAAVFSILGGGFAWGQFGIDAACAVLLGGFGGAIGAAKKSK